MSAKTCKGTGHTAALRASGGGRSYTGNYKGPTPAGSGLQQRGAKERAFCPSELLLFNALRGREVNGEASQ